MGEHQLCRFCTPLLMMAALFFYMFCYQSCWLSIDGLFLYPISGGVYFGYIESIIHIWINDTSWSKSSKASPFQQYRLDVNVMAEHMDQQSQCMRLLCLLAPTVCDSCDSWWLGAFWFQWQLLACLMPGSWALWGDMLLLGPPMVGSYHCWYPLVVDVMVQQFLYLLSVLSYWFTIIYDCRNPTSDTPVIRVQWC